MTSEKRDRSSRRLSSFNLFSSSNNGRDSRKSSLHDAHDGPQPSPGLEPPNAKHTRGRTDSSRHGQTRSVSAQPPSLVTALTSKIASPALRGKASFDPPHSETQPLHLPARPFADPRPRSNSDSQPRKTTSLTPNGPISPIHTVMRTDTTDSLQMARKMKRKSWLPGSGGGANAANSRQKTMVVQQQEAPGAWVAGHPDKVPYDINPLVYGDRVPELWDDNGDTLVHLFPKAANIGPSIRIRSEYLNASSLLKQFTYDNLNDYQIRNINSGQTTPRPKSRHSFEAATPPLTPKTARTDNSGSEGSRNMRVSSDESLKNINLFLPVFPQDEPNHTPQNLADSDVEKLIAARNLFAFLIGQSLIATERKPKLFSIFLSISEQLQAYEFGNWNASTFGDVAASSFDNYVDELGMADVRSSRETTLEMVVLGERMRSAALYNEAYIHAVGKYADIVEIAQFPGPDAKFNLISPITRSRMELASIDLTHREHTIQLRLTDFEFPSLFAGILSSRTADERKLLQFSNWRDAFNATRRHVLGFLKRKYGAWPPNAKSKKNNLTISGLNRVVLQDLYYDIAEMYNLYVDRHNLTTRTGEVAPPSPSVPGESLEAAAIRVLRQIFDEYDRSTPPVQPPIEFDVPLLPTLAPLHNSHRTFDAKLEAAARNKRLTPEEITSVLSHACNPDSLPTPGTLRYGFLASIRSFERKEAEGRTLNELMDLRAGMWMFMYAAIQALPMLVIDAPGVRFHQRVEYFLCEPPRNGVPWSISDEAGGGPSKRASVAKNGLLGGSNIDEHSVEGIYRRSHCWIVGAKWRRESRIAQPPSPVPLHAEVTPSIAATLSGRPSVESHESSPRGLGRLRAASRSNQSAPMLLPIPLTADDPLVSPADSRPTGSRRDSGGISHLIGGIGGVAAGYGGGQAAINARHRPRSNSYSRMSPNLSPAAVSPRDLTPKTSAEFSEDAQRRPAKTYPPQDMPPRRSFEVSSARQSSHFDGSGSSRSEQALSPVSSIGYTPEEQMAGALPSGPLVGGRPESTAFAPSLSGSSLYNSSQQASPAPTPPPQPVDKQHEYMPHQQQQPPLQHQPQRRAVRDSTAGPGHAAPPAPAGFGVASGRAAPPSNAPLPSPGLHGGAAPRRLSAGGPSRPGLAPAPAPATGAVNISAKSFDDILGSIAANQTAAEEPKKEKKKKGFRR